MLISYNFNSFNETRSEIFQRISFLRQRFRSGWWFQSRRVCGWRHRRGDSRDAVLVQCVQGSVAVLSGGSLIHVPEALHGGDVPLDALLREVQLGHKRQRSAVVAAEQHRATVVALRVADTCTSFTEDSSQRRIRTTRTLCIAYRGYEAVL